MKFLTFILTLGCSYWLFWHVLYLIISLPGYGVAKTIQWVVSDEPTPAKRPRRRLFWPLMALAFLMGTIVPSTLYAGLIFAVASLYAHSAVHPWLYLALGGLCSLTVIAPSGEINIAGVLVSFISYACLNLLTLPKEVGLEAVDVAQISILLLSRLLGLWFLLVPLIWIFKGARGRRLRVTHVAIVIVLTFFVWVILLCLAIVLATYLGPTGLPPGGSAALLVIAGVIVWFGGGRRLIPAKPTGQRGRPKAEGRL